MNAAINQLSILTLRLGQSDQADQADRQYNNQLSHSSIMQTRWMCECYIYRANQTPVA